jgi:hypothetical protein
MPKHLHVKNLLLISLLGIHTTVCSQSISGRIVENGKALSLVNVLLVKVNDSSLVTATISNDAGKFAIDNINKGLYFLKMSRVGYKEHYTPNFNLNDNFETPLITLSRNDNQLDQVTVTGKRPFVEQRIDRMIVNVANSIIASGTTALEVLEKAPGVIIDRQNDQIIFKGKEGVIVHIDGKQTYLSMQDLVSLLRSMPSDNIDRIELITNPSAKYDASGNAGIIDIRLKKNNNLGTNGLVSLSAGSGRYGRQRGSFQVNHRTAKVNVFGNYSANRERTYMDFDIFRNQPDSSQRNLIHSHSFIRFRNMGHSAKAGVDYFITNKTTVGVVWTGNWNTVREKSPAEITFRRSDQSPFYYHTLSDKSIDNIQSNHLFNFNIQHSYSSKSQINVDIDFGQFNRTFDNRLNTITLVPASPGDPVVNLFSYMPTGISIFTFKSDYSKQLRKGWKMEAGIKVSNVRADNNMKLSTGTDGNLAIDSALSDHFKYQEEVYAGYLSFSGKLNEKTDVLIGLRGEQTHSVGNSITLKEVITRNYFNVFPSLFINRLMNKNNSITFSYSYRIDRPNYQALNPARSYLDPFSFSSGNSFMTPQYSHSLELKHGFKNKLFTSVGATFIDDLIFFVIQPLDGKISQRRPENLGKSQAFNLTMSFPVNVMREWTMQNTLIGIYSSFHFTYRSIPIDVEQMAGRFTSSNAFVLGKGWTGELMGRLNTPAVNALQKSPWLGSLDAGIQKSFLKNWKAKLNVQDIFHTNRIMGKLNAADYMSNVRITFDSRIVLLNVTYALGNQQLKSSRQRKGASEEESQRAN